MPAAPRAVLNSVAGGGGKGRRTKGHGAGDATTTAGASGAPPKAAPSAGTPAKVSPSVAPPPLPASSTVEKPLPTPRAAVEILGGDLLSASEALSIGEILLKARELFIEHGKGEAKVSLREVKRIRDHLETFGAMQPKPRAIANALWLALGAGLAPEERSGELGAKLRRLITSISLADMMAGAMQS